MSDIMLLDWLQDGLRRVNHAVEVSRLQRQDAQNGHVTAGPAASARHTIQDTIALCELLPLLLARVWRRCWEFAGQEAGDGSNSTGQLLRRMFDATVQAMEAVRDSISANEDLASRSSGLERLEAALSEARRIRADLESAWLWFTKEDEEQAKAAIARGEGVDVEEAFAQMAGLTVDELRAKVEAHNRKYHPNGGAER